MSFWFNVSTGQVEDDENTKKWDEEDKEWEEG